MTQGKIETFERGMGFRYRAVPRDRPRRWEAAGYWHYRISFHSVSLLLAGESHRKSYSDVARPTVVPSVGMIAQVLYNHG